MSWQSVLYSLILPVSYLTLLLGSLATFSSLYRRRQAAKQASLAPWFGPHVQRNVYLSLLELQANPSAAAAAVAAGGRGAVGAEDTSSPKIPDTLLKAALLRRAIEDVHRLLALQAQKPALTQLLQRGSVGDELMQRLQVAEREMELEVKDVVVEANALAPQQAWGATIFQSASEAAHREIVARRLRAIEARRPAMRAEWERRRAGLREGLLRELDQEGGAAVGSTTTPSSSAMKATGVAAAAPAPPRSAGSSDEDAPVLVEAAEAAESLEADADAAEGDGGAGGASAGGIGSDGGSGGGGGSTRRKKKGKK